MATVGDVRVEWLTIAGDVEAWRSIGLTTTAAPNGDAVPLIGTSLRIVPSAGAADVGIVGWALSGATRSADGTVDGLATEFVDASPPVFATHALGATGLDHVVVTTDDLLRTTSAIEHATMCELRRVREVGSMRQGFHRIGRGGLVVEVVERDDHPASSSAFWGIVLIVDDLDAAASSLGDDLIGEPRDAVQPGRRIATLRPAAGLGVPLALMTP